MFPEEFIQRISSQEYVDPGTLLKALEEPSPVSLRVNHTKWSKLPLNSEPVPWCTSGYYLPYRPAYTLDPLFHSGCYYPQEASSMFLEKVYRAVAGFREKLKVLDLCGSPGGKSTHICNLIGPSGLLISNEVIRSRASVLAETLTKWGSGNVMVTQNDPSVLGRLTGYFDLIIVDAPCSGEGMFRSSATVSEWSVENTDHCSVRQKRILTDIWPALKEDGFLVYSTCTFNPGENEENINWLLSRHMAECVRIDVNDYPGIIEVDNHGFYGYGFYPDRVRGEGFFISVVRKTSLEPSKHFRSSRMADYKPGKSDIALASEWTDFPPDRILKRGEEILAIPTMQEDYFYLFQNLKIVKSGTRLAVRKKDNYIPTPELSLSVHQKGKVFPFRELDLSKALSYLRRDSLNWQVKSKGWNLVTYRGVNLGFVNNLGNRLNNYFPVEWRIRLDITGVSQILPVAWKDEAI
jgi:16S rRNA C967 or C1407 C5-methylase (RsmB/RsmF family)/NOL1/NOP2/fmu family ribosome biogenesis protein